MFATRHVVALCALFVFVHSGCNRPSDNAAKPVPTDPSGFASLFQPTVAPPIGGGSAATISPPTGSGIQDPFSDAGDKTEADARAYLERKIGEFVGNGPAPVMVMTRELPDGRQAASPYKTTNPAFAKVLGQYYSDVRSDMVRAVVLRHVVKLRKGELCHLVNDNDFVVHYTVTGTRGDDECVRILHLISDDQRAKTVEYRRKQGYKVDQPEDDAGHVMFTTILNNSFSESVRRINTLRAKAKVAQK